MMRRSRHRLIVEPFLKEDALFMSPHFKPEHSSHFGKRASGFHVSHIFSMSGKMWQFRTVRFNGAHYVTPFIINGGGISAKQPILCKNFLRTLGAEHSNTCKSFAVESPLGDLTTFSEWDDERQANITKNDEIHFNMIGHGLADLIQQINGWGLESLVSGSASIDEAVASLERRARPDVRACLRRNPHDVRRELQHAVVALKREETDLKDVSIEDYPLRAGWLLDATCA